MSILKMDCYSEMPKISYLTALDFYIITCYGFVLFSILEFAVVHQDKFDYDEFVIKVLENKTNFVNSETENKSKKKLTSKKQRYRRYFGFLARNKLETVEFQNENNFNVSEKVAHRLMRRSTSALFLENRKPVHLTSLNAVKMKSFNLIALYENSIKINKIDQISKILFPILFTLFNLTYFVFHLNKRSIF